MRYIIVLDFGYTEDDTAISTSSIRELSEYALQHYGLYLATTILAQTHTYQYMKRIQDSRIEADILEIPVPQSAASDHTYDALKAAHEMIESIEHVRTKQSLPHPFEVLLVTHKMHAPRAVRQGKLHGLDLVPTSDLPGSFYSAAAQWWCRSKLHWHLHEALEYWPLRLAQQL